MLGAADLVAQCSPELARGGATGDIGEEPVTIRQPCLGGLVEPGDTTSQQVEVIDIDRTIGQRGTEFGSSSTASARRNGCSACVSETRVASARICSGKIPGVSLASSLRRRVTASVRDSVHDRRALS